MSTVAAASRMAGRSGPVPLALRNLLANKPRLLRSSGGIGFAVLLMLMQLGFEQAFFDSSLQIIRGLDGDLFLQSAHKYQFATQDPFPAATLETAGRVPGIATARPLYADWYDVFWKNPSNGKVFLVRALAFQPDEPVFSFADVDAERQQLNSADTILVDRRARRFLGMNSPAAKSELNGATVRIVGNFTLGPDFQSDGTVIMGERTFAAILHGAAGNPPGIEAGVIKLAPGADPNTVQAALRQALPPEIAVMTKPELIAFERARGAGRHVMNTKARLDQHRVVHQGIITTSVDVDLVAEPREGAGELAYVDVHAPAVARAGLGERRGVIGEHGQADHKARLPAPF